MKKLFVTMLQHKKKDYLLVITGGAFTIAIIFFTTALVDCLLLIKEGKAGGLTSVVFASESAFTFSYVFLLMLFVMLLMSYIRKRVGDYHLLDSMGMKKKHKYRFIAVEYTGIILGSFCVGLIAGVLASKLLVIVLGRIFSNVIIEVHYGVHPFVMTLIVGVIIFSLSFIVCDEIIACFGINLQNNVGNGVMRAGVLRILGVIGSGIFVLGFVTLWTYWGKVGKTIPTFLGAGSMLVLMLAVMGTCLTRLRRKKRAYYQKLFWTDQWYGRFFYQVNLSYVMAAFTFIMIFLFAVSVMDSVPITDSANYPYDLVWMANKEDQEFLNELKEQYQVQTTQIPCIRVTTPDFGEHTGISQTEYQELIGEKLDLKEDEIHVVYQRARKELGTLGIDYGNRNPRIHPGKPEYFLWIWDAPMPIPSARFDTRYQVKSTENRIITGVIESRELGKIRGEVFEDIIVFSDECYRRLYPQAEGANLAVLFTIPNHNKEVLRQVTDYAKQNSEVNFFDYNRGNFIYEGRKLLMDNRQSRLYDLTSAVINTLIFLICILFFFYIKCENEYGEMEYKNHFLQQYGMSKNLRRKLIAKQEVLTVKLITFPGCLCIILYLLAGLWNKELPEVWMIRYITAIGALLMFIMGVILLESFVLARRMWRKMERRFRR